MHTQQKKWAQGKFADHPGYQDVNRHLLELISAGLAGKTVLDGATGAGAFIELVYEATEQKGGSAPRAVIGTDNNRERIEEAFGRLKRYNPKIAATSNFYQGINPGLHLVEADVTDLSFLASNSVDVYINGNALHLVANKSPESLELAITEASRILKPGGKFAANSTYIDGFRVDGTEDFYGKWVFPAIKLMRTLTQFDKSKKKELALLNRQNLEAILQKNGLKILKSETTPVNFDKEFYERIAENDTDFVQGIADSVGAVIEERDRNSVLGKLSEKLKASVASAMNERKYVQRNYYWVVAEKKQIGLMEKAA